MPFTSTEIWTAAGAVTAVIGSIGAVWISMLKYMGFDKKLDANTKENKEHREAVDKTMDSQNAKIKLIDEEITVIRSEISEGFNGHRKYLESNYMLAKQVDNKFQKMEETLLTAVKANTDQLNKIEGIITDDRSQQIIDLKEELRDERKKRNK